MVVQYADIRITDISGTLSSKLVSKGSYKSFGIDFKRYRSELRFRDSPKWSQWLTFSVIKETNRSFCLRIEITKLLKLCGNIEYHLKIKSIV